MIDASKILEVQGAEFRTRRFSRHDMERSRPLVVRQLFDPSDVFSFEQFCEHHRDQPVQLREFGASRPPKWKWSSYGRWFSIPLSDYLAMLADGRAERRDVYLGQLPMQEAPTARQAVHFLDELGAGAGLTRLYSSLSGYFWIGPRGHVEPLHSDEGDGTLLQIQGRKRVVLFPASQLYNLYPFPLFAKIGPWVSQVDLDAPDFERFPRLREALKHRIEVVLEPGDMIYLPSQWSHEVSTLEGAPVISISRLWRISPWSRNFSHPRAFLWYLKRLLPIGLVTRLHSVIASLHRSAERSGSVRQ